MNLISRLNKLKKEALSNIEEAASKGEVAEISANTKLLEEVERLLRRVKELAETIENIEKRAHSPLKPQAFSKDIVQVYSGTITHKQKAKHFRAEFVRYLQALGIILTHREGRIYETQNGKVAGIAYASERQPNKWWLDLMPEDYDAIVLLCKKKNGEIINFIFPKDFYLSIKNDLGHDSKGIPKFNIMFRGGFYRLKIPHGDSINIDKFINDYDSLK